MASRAGRFRQNERMGFVDAALAGMVSGRQIANQGKESLMGPNWAQDEGAKAFEQGRKIEQNPYPHDSQHWWQNEEWEKGWKHAEAAYNDDYDD